MNNTVAVNNFELQISPFHDFFIKNGFVDSHSHNGRKIFSVYTNFSEEYETLCSGAGLRDLSPSGLIELKGTDVSDFLHRISTNDLRNLEKDSVTRTIFTNEKGRILDSSAVINFGDSFLLAGSHSHHKKLLQWLNKYIIADDVKVMNVVGKYSFFEILGPQANSFMIMICGSQIDSMEENKVKVISTEGMNFFLVKLRERNNQYKYWLLSDIMNGEAVIKYMLENKGAFTFNLIGEDAYNVYRVEQGIPAAPNELNDFYNPHEAKLLNEVSFTKGCYIGQEVIARLDTYDKVQKYLTGVIFNETLSEAGLLTIYDDEENEVGKVTSVVYSPKFKTSIGLAYLRKQIIVDNLKLTAKNEAGKVYEISVKELPFKK